MRWVFRHKKLNAGALQYTLFIAVIIALSLFAFISYQALQQKLRSKSATYKTCIDAVNYAFTQLENFPDQALTQDAASPLLTDSIQPWGLFSVHRISAKKNAENFERSALVAWRQTHRPGLYLSDQNQPLVMVGMSQLEGRHFLPKRGVKSGSIAGRSFYGKQLFYGSSEIAKKNIPQFSSAVNFESLQAYITTFNETDFIPADATSLPRSFAQSTQVITGDQSLALENVNFAGNYIIYAPTKITVHPSAQLNDVILVAPEIEIQTAVEGNFQAFASRKITVGKKAVLQYPSALRVDRPSPFNLKTDEASQIILAESAVVKGIIAYFQPHSPIDRKTHIFIQPDAVVFGEVYCQQNLDLRGTVYGSVYTNGFIVNDFGASYINHLYDGKIISTGLSERYAGLHMEKATPTVAKWINY